MPRASNLDRTTSVPIVLISATDTSVGKTWIGAALARALTYLGHRVIAIKPLETGCDVIPSETEDGILLARATKQSAPTQALLRFQLPVAPPQAAEREGRRIDFADLTRQICSYGANADLVLIEGAGGLYSPLTWEQSAVDLAKALSARVLIVAPDRLGVINHALMTLALLEQNDIDVVGLVLNAPERGDTSTGSNANAIARVSGFTRIVQMPRTRDTLTIEAPIRQVIEWLGLEADKG
jgi:dethiobiotin synthetase